MTSTPIRLLLIVAASAMLATGIAACKSKKKFHQAAAPVEVLLPPAEVPNTPPNAPNTPQKAPNILFILTDDVGIDQFRAFGYGGPEKLNPSMPNIDQIASEGVRFRNAWSMPACSVSRSVFFTGRFPLRTDLYGALGPDDLANSMVSPWETTVPKLLKERGYESAIFGKFHLGLQGNSPYKLAMPHSLGWDYFSGWLDETGDPSSIDTTAGGVSPAGTYACGYVPGSGLHGGADIGACYAGDGTCKVVKGALGDANPPGRQCRDEGGIFDPGKTSCQSPPPSYVDFNVMSAHFVSPLVINHPDGSVEQVPLTDRRARTYRGSLVVDEAVAWINARPKNKPWMATVSFATVHTPLQPPPRTLLPADAIAANGLDCANTANYLVLSKQMIEALDTEIGRLLVDTGLARRRPNGTLDYRPDNSDTMVVFVNDNGTLGYTVMPPFDGSRAKGTPYQTGVWSPLIVAGPLVEKPDRNVPHMVNTADLFQLFGEIARIDVKKSVPRKLDTAPLLPYLVNPKQEGLRKWNFTQFGVNLQADGAINGPCQMASTCSQIPVTKGVCEDNGGTWYGAGANASLGLPSTDGFKYCCEVQAWLASKDQPVNSIQPLSGVAVRNERYKLVRNTSKLYIDGIKYPVNACQDVTSNEFYEIDEAVPEPRLDTADAMLNPASFTNEQQTNYEELSKVLDSILASQPECEGDGNGDGVVNNVDLTDYDLMEALSQGQSSWYDLNLDGVTNSADLTIVNTNFGRKCPKALFP